MAAFHHARFSHAASQLGVRSGRRIHALAAEELLAHCRLHLSSYKVPASVAFVTEIELTASGKVRHG